MIRISDSFKWQDEFYKGIGSGSGVGSGRVPSRDMDTYYIWGANTYNYDYPSGKLLGYIDRITNEKKKGSGQAGLNGPVKGKAHPNFIGVVSIFKPGDTLTHIYKCIDDKFHILERKLHKGYNIEFPLNKDIQLPKKVTMDFIIKNHGLGKGVARERLKSKLDIDRWNKIQKRITQNIRGLYSSSIL